MRNWLFEDISSLTDAYRAKQVSPVEITAAILSRIQTLNPALNAYITVMAEEAMEQAKRLESEWMKGEVRGPLHGVPIAIKDNVQTKGIRTTAGSRVLADWIPSEDATVVEKLRAAGAILIGKANLHEFAMGATTENAAYGNAGNPWDLGKIAGGSSGGSGVAVAAGLAYGAVGSDTAGSIRLPSAQCGIVGLKPTYGRVSRYGTIPFSWSLDHLGPMARNVRDTATMFEMMAGYDQRDPGSVRYAEADAITNSSLPDLKGRKLGLCRSYFFEGVDPGIQAIVDKAIVRLKELGAEIVEIAIPDLDAAQLALRRIAQAEGYTFHKPIYTARPELYGDDVRYRLQFGSQVTADQYLSALRTRRAFVDKTLKAMDGLDALVTPMNHNPPFGIGTVTPERAINNMFDLTKAPLVNLLGFPAVTVPADLLDGKLPVGVQFIGKPFEERKLLALAQCFEDAKLWQERLRMNTAYETANP